MDKFNILFTNVGRRVVVIRAFAESLKKLHLTGNIIGVDANQLSPAFYVTDKSYKICTIEEDSYIPSLLDICKNESINLILSFIDTDLFKLAENKELFQRQGIFAMISSTEVIRLARDKKMTLDFFKKNDICTPRCWNYEEAISQKPYPLLVKPIDGSASNKVYRIENEKDLRFYYESVPKPLLLDYVQGYEYTIDIFINTEKKVKAIVPRKRLEIREGEVSKSRITLEPKIIEAGEKVGRALAKIGGLGMINSQCIVDEQGRVKFIEINPRFGGGCPLSLEAGYPFTDWVIQMVLNKEFSPMPEDRGDGLTMLRYDEGIFIRSEIR
jgi:carbamoyl-phosphate synthase large subunit